MCDAAGLLVVTVAYPAIAIKLCFQRHKIRPFSTTAVFNVADSNVVVNASTEKHGNKTCQDPEVVSRHSGAVPGCVYD